MQNISPARSMSRILATADCGFSSVTLPFRVLTSFAAITSVVTEAESA
jgi:hypothetical protein